jgi:GntR family transcriptional regulator
MTSLLSTSQDPPLGQSRYGALAAALKRRIVAGDWPPGSALPAEQALASQHGVALGTLRQALALLVDEGLVARIHGKGTFVRTGLAGAPMLRFFRFGDGSSVVPESRILSRQVLAPPVEVAQALGAGPDATALHLRRLRLLADVPRLVEDIWLPLPRCAALQDGEPAAWGQLLYPLLASACGVHVHRAVDEIGFGLLAAADAQALALPSGHPCAIVQRLAFDLSGRCVEWRSTRGDAHAFRYTVSIT